MGCVWNALPSPRGLSRLTCKLPLHSMVEKRAGEGRLPKRKETEGQKRATLRGHSSVLGNGAVSTFGEWL
jgi:hypothetical protein